MMPASKSASRTYSGCTNGIIHAPAIALGMIARIPAVDVDQPALTCTPHHAMGCKVGDEFGKQADDVEAHGPSEMQWRLVCGSAPQGRD